MHRMGGWRNTQFGLRNTRRGRAEKCVGGRTGGREMLKGQTEKRIVLEMDRQTRRHTDKQQDKQRLIKRWLSPKNAVKLK